MSLINHVQPANTGVFDWYQATTNHKIDQFRDVMSSKYDLADWKPMRGMHNYHNGAQLVRGETVLLSALWGGPNGENVHAWSSGYEAREFSKVLRETMPKHTVTRADCALDFIEVNAWDSIELLSKHVSDEHDIKIQHLGDFHKKLDGRTLNIGGQKSDVRVTCYEKGIQVGDNPNWVRAEVKVKPPKPHPKSTALDPRIAVSKMQPIELWGCSIWSNYLLSQLTGQIVPSLAMRTWRDSDDERAWRFMCKQYKNVILKKLIDHGSPSALGEQLIHDIMHAGDKN